MIPLLQLLKKELISFYQTVSILRKKQFLIIRHLKLFIKNIFFLYQTIVLSWAVWTVVYYSILSYFSYITSNRILFIKWHGNNNLSNSIEN